MLDGYFEYGHRRWLGQDASRVGCPVASHALSNTLNVTFQKCPSSAHPVAHLQQFLINYCSYSLTFGLLSAEVSLPDTSSTSPRLTTADGLLYLRSHANASCSQVSYAPLETRLLTCAQGSVYSTSSPRSVVLLLIILRVRLLTIIKVLYCRENRLWP